MSCGIIIKDHVYPIICVLLNVLEKPILGVRVSYSSTKDAFLVNHAECFCLGCHFEYLTFFIINSLDVYSINIY